MAAVSKVERIEALKAGRADRPCASAFWRHFYLHERSPEDLAHACLSFQEIYDWDFIKVPARTSLWAEDWGAKFEFSEDENAPHTMLDYPVKEPADWEKFSPLRPDRGSPGEQLKALRLIKKSLKEPVYFLGTVFSPLSIAGRLAGGVGPLKRFLMEHPKRVLLGLEVVTATLEEFVRAALEAGASGIFFSTTLFASYNSLTRELYHRFGRPFDLRVLEAANAGSFNVLHVCMANNMLLDMLNYPVHAFNWDARGFSNPSLGDIFQKTDKVLIGGIDQTGSLLQEDDEECEREIDRAFEATRHGERFILSAGCSISTRTKDKKLQFIKERLSRKK